MLLHTKRSAWPRRRVTRVTLMVAVLSVALVVVAFVLATLYCRMLRSHWEQAVTLGSSLSTPYKRGEVARRLLKETNPPPAPEPHRIEEVLTK